MRQRAHFRIMAILCLVFVAAFFTMNVTDMTANAQAATSDPGVERDVMAELNAWRMTEGLAPMQFNANLQALALKQAKFLVNLTSLPHGGDLHLDDKGLLPPQRASTVEWPSYGIAARTAIGENAAVGTAKFALRYWLHSEIHKKTALNPAYREMGVAALPYHKHFMIIAVFGARPDYLPAFLFPEEGTIYFTNEQYKFKTGGSWIQNVAQVELYDANGQPLLANPVPFTTKIKLPPLTTDSFDVVYRNGKNSLRYTVNIEKDVAVLPHHLQPAKITLQAAKGAVTVASPVPATTAATSLPAPTRVPLYPTNTPRFQPAYPTNTPRSIAVAPTTAPAATRLPTESPLSILETDYTPEIMVLYDDDSLIIVNDTDKPADISDLKIRYQGKILEAKRWANVVPMPLDKFPADHCLVLETSDAKPFIPEACKVVRAVIWVPEERAFWQQTGFEVLRGNQVVAACEVLEKHDEADCEAVWR